MSGSSVRTLPWAMRQSLAWAHKRGLTGVVATQDVELPPLPAKKIEPPSSCPCPASARYRSRLGTVFAVIAWTGCRRGEAAGLQWRDVDLDRGSVLIARSISTIPGGSEVKGTKTGDQRRIVIGPRTVGLLCEHRARCEARAGGRGAKLEPAEGRRRAAMRLDSAC